MVTFIVTGKYVTGWGLLFKVVDTWWGQREDDEQMIQLENVENGKFAWVPAQVVRQQCEDVDYAG
jgi:hypothetical protein